MIEFPTPDEFDRALRRLSLVLDGDVPEFGPIVDDATEVVATWLVHLIDANPALARHCRAQLDSAPPLRGVRSVPVAALLPAVRLAAVFGAPATDLEKIA